MTKSKGLVGKVKNAAWGAAMGLAALTGTAYQANAALVPVSSFYDLRSSPIARDVRMDTDWTTYADNLMIRDPVTGTDSIVNGVYQMGFINYVPDGANVVGYANNDPTQEGMEGFMSGYYCTGLGEGNQPDDVWVIHDGNNDGIGTFDTAAGQWYLGADDTLYNSRDILFGSAHIRGDVSQLPPYAIGQRILPHMIIDPVPEPATLGVLGLGAGLALGGRKRKSIESKGRENK